MEEVEEELQRQLELERQFWEAVEAVEEEWRQWQ